MSQNKSTDSRSADLQILVHHIYEYRKGVRNMVLHTMCSHDCKEAEQILSKRGICYIVKTVNAQKVNVFFGNPDCVEVIQSFGNISLSDYTAEQDFILGIMLGYNSDLQCKRYLRKKEQEQKHPEPYITYKNTRLSKSS